MIDKADAVPEKGKRSVPIWLLVAILIALSVGILVGLVLVDTLAAEHISLSIPGLISFCVLSMLTLTLYAKTHTIFMAFTTTMYWSISFLHLHQLLLVYHYKHSLVILL